jgi:hypothetical protein
MIKITDKQAAEILNVSVGYVHSLIIRGILNDYSDSMVEYSLSLDKVVEYKNTSDIQTREALRELVRLTEEYGGYDEDTLVDVPVFE